MISARNIAFVCHESARKLLIGAKWSAKRKRKDILSTPLISVNVGRTTKNWPEMREYGKIAQFLS